MKLRLYHDMYRMQPPPPEEMHPTDAEGFHLRGVANFHAFEFRAATNDFTRAIELDPDYVDALFHRGIVRVVRGQYDDAIRDFDRVIQLDPQHAAAYYNRGRVRYWKGDLAGALADFEQARRLDPRLARELNLSAVIRRLRQGPGDDSLRGRVQRFVNRFRRSSRDGTPRTGRSTDQG